MATTSSDDSALPSDWKKQFEVAVEIVALRIAARQCNTFTKRLAGHIYHKPRVRPIVADPEAEEGATTRLLLLSEAVKDFALAELPAELRDFALAEGAQPVRYTLHLGYEHLAVEQVMRQLLPAGLDVPSSFEQVGHVAHVNLREEHLPYKRLIGQVLLDKNAPRLRSVVNKVESLSRDGTAADQRTPADERAWRFRVFPMEVLAGDDSLLTSVRENGAKFELDYREVYWNSRLETEHKRIVEQLGAGAVVADAFAGIGPFAIPAALRGARVYANDLNPASHRYLERNVAVNKAADPRADVIAIAERTMGCPLPGATAHVVRDVSPHKLMLCLEFDMPEAGWARSEQAAKARAAQRRAEPPTDEDAGEEADDGTADDGSERVKRPRAA